MSRILTSGQAEELHKSIIAYFLAADQTSIVPILRSEFGLGEDIFNADVAKKYEPFLEKKWTTAERLEKKIQYLEIQNNALENELISSKYRTGSQKHPTEWLPQSPRHSLESHQGTVNCIAFHPKFSSCASGSDDCSIKIWDWELGELEKTIRAHTQAVRDIDYSDEMGSVLLASCSSDLTIKLWDVADDYANIRTFQGHEHSITAVRFVPKNKVDNRRNWLISASGDQTLKIWNVSDGTCVRTLQGHTNWVRGVSPSSDGRYLLSASMDKTARLWDIASSVQTLSTFLGHENGINCCAIAPTATYRNLAALAGQKTTYPLSNAAGFMATDSRDRSIKLWDGQGTCFATFVGHSNWVNALAFHPGGRYLLSVSDDKTLRCWDLSLNGECTYKLEGIHTQFITCLRWADNFLKDTSQRKEEQTNNGVNKSQLRLVFATGSMDGSIKVFSS